jgi:lipid A disaccharide synthetase
MIILVGVISKESQQEGLGKSKFNISELGSNAFLDSLNKLPFLLQRLLKA